MVPDDDVLQLRASTPAIGRRGLGYQGVFHGGWVLFLTRVTSKGGEVHGMLDVSGRAGGLYKGRFNLSSDRTRGTLAGYLQRRTGDYLGWGEILEQFCRHVLRLDEQGPEEQFIGDMEPLGCVPHILDPILPEGDPTILFGPPEAGKSTLACAIAFSVQTGIPILGWTPVKRNVLVLDWEAKQRNWNDRLVHFANGMNATAPRICYRRVTHHRLADLSEQIADQVTRDDIGLLVVDSATPAEGGRGEGGGAEDATLRFYAALRAIGITALVVDQVSKASRDSAGGSPYGSVFKEYEARSAWEIRAEQEPDEVVTHQVQLIHHKFNDGAKQRPIGLRLGFASGVSTIERCEITAPDLVQRRSLTDRVRFLLKTGPLTTTEIAEELGSGGSNIRHLLRRSQAFIRLPDGRIGLRA